MQLHSLLEPLGTVLCVWTALSLVGGVLSSIFLRGATAKDRQSEQECADPAPGRHAAEPRPEGAARGIVAHPGSATLS